MFASGSCISRLRSLLQVGRLGAKSTAAGGHSCQVPQSFGGQHSISHQMRRGFLILKASARIFCGLLVFTSGSCISRLRSLLQVGRLGAKSTVAGVHSCQVPQSFGGQRSISHQMRRGVFALEGIVPNFLWPVGFYLRLLYLPPAVTAAGGTSWRQEHSRFLLLKASARIFCDLLVFTLGSCISRLRSLLQVGRLGAKSTAAGGHSCQVPQSFGGQHSISHQMRLGVFAFEGIGPNFLWPVCFFLRLLYLPPAVTAAGGTSWRQEHSRWWA